METSGNIPPKEGTIKGKNGRDLVDAKEIKKRWKEYAEELCKKDPTDPDYSDGVVSHPEPDILEHKVRWALRSTVLIKLVGVMKLQQNDSKP